MQVITRLAKLKFMNGVPGRTASCESAAVKMLLEEYVMKGAPSTDKDAWRRARMYNEEVDTVLRSYHKVR
jgi:hypothetical protein